MKFVLRWFFVFVILFTACKRDTEIIPAGKIKLKFEHFYNNEQVIYDSLLYENAAGNSLMINEIQYFISDIILTKVDETQVQLTDRNNIFYIDKDILSTLEYTVNDAIPAGDYKKIQFVFGISADKNLPNTFTNSPEKDMFWPYILGGPNGGYHYMKLNGKWLRKSDNMITPFNLHLGVGQLYAGNVVNPDSIIGYIQNYFTVNIPVTELKIAHDKTTAITFRMNIEQWFQSPNVYDFDFWGSHIMQNQEAMHSVCENGYNVFTISKISNE